MNIIGSILASSERSKGIAQLSDEALGNLLLEKVWAQVELFSEESDILDEVIFRLRKRGVSEREDRLRAPGLDTNRVGADEKKGSRSSLSP